MRHGRPKLSIIVLAAGGDPGRLRATLDSVRDQPSPSIEILVVSRAHDADVAQTMAGDDTRVRFFTAGSVHQARAAGLRRARGAFVVVAAPGDTYAPGALAELADNLPADAAVLLQQDPTLQKLSTLAEAPGLARAAYLGALLAPRARVVDAVRRTADDDPNGSLVSLQLLRAGVSAAGYPAFRDARSAAPGPFAMRPNPLPDLSAQAERDLATLAALADLPDARACRAAGALAGLLPFLEVAELASEDEWAVLANHAAELRDAAGPQLGATPVRARVLALLAADGHRDEVTRLASTPDDFTGEVRGDGVYAPFDVSPGLLPERMFRVGAEESMLEARARRLLVEGTVVRIELVVQVGHVDVRPDDTYEVLVAAEGDFAPLRVTATGAGPDGVLVTAETDADALSTGVHPLAVHWSQGQVQRGNLVSSLMPIGSAARGPVPFGARRSVELNTRHERVGLVVTGHQEPAASVVRRVEVTDAGLRLTVDGTIDRVRLEGQARIVEGAAGAAGFWTIPMSDDAWGLGVTPLPSGFYRLELSRAGQSVRGTMDPALMDQIPYDVRTANHRVTVERRGGDQVGIRLGPLLTDDEIGPRAQTRLQREFTVVAPPLDPNLVYFQSFTGQWANDNPLAIQRALFRRRQDLDLRWVVADSSATVPEGCTPLLFRSREWYDVMTRAGYLVTNIELEKWYARRPGQQVLQTFHGYPSKAMGLGLWRPRGMTPRQIENQLDHTSRVWNNLVTPTAEMDQYYRRDYAYDGTILPLGYPRNDVLVTEAAEELRVRTRERLGIRPDQHAILYAPTWRDDLATNFRAARAVHHLDVARTAAALGEEYVLLLRGHRFHAPTGGSGRVVDVTGHPDINHLIAASDAAVLDYSSLRFDFALTGRPMVFLVPDLDSYTSRVRGFLWDYRETAPGPLVSSTAEVITMLRDLDALRSQTAADLAAFNARYNALHDGHAAERVVSAFFADLLD